MSSTQERRACWVDLLAEQKDSGLTVTAWCQEHNIPINTFYYWRKRLSFPAITGPEWVSLSVSTPASSKDDGGSTPLTVRVGAVSIDILRGFDPKLLSDVLRVLEARC